MQRKFGYLQIFPKADDKRCDQTVTKVVRRKFVEKPQSKRNGKDGVLRHANMFFIKEDSMKKKLTMFLSVLMAFLLTFSFAACDKKGEDGEKENNSTAVANNVLIEKAFGSLLDSEELYVLIKNAEFAFESAEGLGLNGDVNGEIAVRKTKDGYDFGLKLNLTILSEELSEENEAYTENSFISLSVYYADGYMYSQTKSFSQVVVEGNGYDSFTDYAEGHPKDAAVITKFPEDFDKIDEMIGNTAEDAESRVDVFNSFNMTNDLSVLVNKLTQIVPELKILGLDNVDSFLSVIKRAAGGLANLATGETDKDENGNRNISLSLILAGIFNQFKSLLVENMENKLGDALDLLLNKESGYVESVIDRLFPAESRSLTIDEFIKELEKTFAELGAPISFKAIVDEIQTISGCTTEQLAEAVNELVGRLLPPDSGAFFPEIIPQDGETFYDTAKRLFFGQSVDTVLKLLDKEGTGMNSASLNVMLKEMLYGENAMLLGDVLANMGEAAGMLFSLKMDKLAANFDFTLDSQDRLTALDANLDAKILLDLGQTAEEGAPAQEMVFADLQTSVSAEIAYSADEKLFAVPEELQVEIIDCPLDFEIGKTYTFDEILAAAGVELTETQKITNSSTLLIYLQDEIGYIRECDEEFYMSNITSYPTPSQYIIVFNAIPTDSVNMYINIKIKDEKTNEYTNYYFKAGVPAEAAAVA